jgi:hypothetical protein
MIAVFHPKFHHRSSLICKLFEYFGHSGKQINRGLSSQVGQRQLGAGGIRAMQPLQKRLCGRHDYGRPVDHVQHGVLPNC